MKKILIAAVVLVGTASMTSCKKDYTCTYDLLGTETVIEYNGLDKDEADAAESACTILAGTWATK
jgi:hypothetical protein